MNYSKRIDQYAKFGIHLGLERINHLLHNLGNPHLQVPTIHIAGTNGKGSVCAFTSSILIKAGYKVGRYISPHLFDWCERITINDRWISKQDFSLYLDRVESAISVTYFPTQFEIVTALMWLYFAENNVDIAVIETGLGGRLDATNVHPQPLVTGITSISRDHWQRLGDMIEQIAYEKAGIIKQNRPLVISELIDSARTVIIQRAIELNAKIISVEKAQLVNQQFTWRNLTFSSGLQGEHQLINSAIALGIINELRQQSWQIRDEAIEIGMAETKWLGRLQWFKWHDRQILLDGAHNVGSAIYLRKFVDQNFYNQSVTWIIGIVSTKDAEGILTNLLRPQDYLLTVPVPEHQTFAPELLASLSQKLLQTQPNACDSLEEALSICLQNNYPQLIICGSLYLLGYFLSQQQAQPD